MTIEFAPIDGYFGKYEISNTGQVKSLSRSAYSTSKRGNRVELKLKEKILKLQHNKGGYRSITLSNNGKVKTHMVHTLVATAFIGKNENKLEVNHIDGNKENNRVENLEYVTGSENKKHAYRIGARPSGALHHFSRLNRDRKGRCLRAKKQVEAMYPVQIELA